MKTTLCKIYCTITDKIEPYAVEVKCSNCKEIYSYMFDYITNNDTNIESINDKIVKCPYCGKRIIIQNYQQIII